VKQEEPWKTFLNWGVVSMFLVMPVVILILHIMALTFPNWLSKELPQQEEFKFLYEFQRMLAILVFGLSGLRTWEVLQERKNGPEKEKR
jgi:hypothetical protein